MQASGNDDPAANSGCPGLRCFRLPLQYVTVTLTVSA